MKRGPIVCLDFDGVLHSYTSGWKGVACIPDLPVPGAMRFIESLQEAGYTVALPVRGEPEEFPHGAEDLHRFFGLSYANYLVLPRSVLRAMPDEWQGRLAALLMEFCGKFDLSDLGDYQVTLRNPEGLYTRDRLSNYRHPDHDYIETLRIDVPSAEGDP